MRNDEIAFDEPRRRLTVGHWSERPTWLRRSDIGADAGWSALVEIRRGVHLLVRAGQGDRSARVELWSGEPDASDGLAVVTEGGELAGVARIPLCTCGERACGHAGVQLATSISASDLPVLVDVLRTTPDRPPQPRSSPVWRGEFAAGRPALG